MIPRSSALPYAGADACLHQRVHDWAAGTVEQRTMGTVFKR
jgi:hypothetical protein